MSDAVVNLLEAELQPGHDSVLTPFLENLKTGVYEVVLRSNQAQELFNIESNVHGTLDPGQDDSSSWTSSISTRLNQLLKENPSPERSAIFTCIAYAALLTFLQSNVTGPPLRFSTAQTILPANVVGSSSALQRLRNRLIGELNQDGIAPYKLIPHIELFCLSRTILSSPKIIADSVAARWARCRLTFLRQRLLSEVSSTLQNSIYDDLDILADNLLTPETLTQRSVASQVEFLLERATIHIHHGLDKFAREDLEQAKQLHGFEYALTGLLGKRTKFQQKETSQLVVLAKSQSDNATTAVTGTTDKESMKDSSKDVLQPSNLDLNDDTLLESISFTKDAAEERALPESLQELDPSNQPLLEPLDATVLLLFASSITNTSPGDGLTREETLPYATRVLEGGSSNWQVYTQALLVRSRIEGYKSRTIERGLLQLQALVDQVIAETYTADTESDESKKESVATSSFLPRAKESESGPVSERLRYIFQLASPTRWDLEAELASRWVSLGGLKSALEIYERLEMWPEVALCWAATDREDKARSIARRQLFLATDRSHTQELDSVRDDDDDGDGEKWEGPERVPPPLDAPRLYCILGDLDNSIAMYEKAWQVSKNRYARAQRSIGRLHLAAKDYARAADAYRQSLRANQLHHGSWFSLGCCLLELSQFEQAVEAFSRCIQVDDSDAESWSNLAAALLRCEPRLDTQLVPQSLLDDEDEPVGSGDAMTTTSTTTLRDNRVDALKALKRAAALKHESYRIWENTLIVAASLSPPDYATVLAAQRRIIELRSKTEGEKCIDAAIIAGLVQHVISSESSYDPTRPGLARVFVRFVDELVVPLITGSAELWRLVGRLALWRNRPEDALDAEEKAWRTTSAQPGWDLDDEKRWNVVVEATVRLCDAYENLGERERAHGLGAGEPVAKDWRFKCRSAVRGIMGRGKSSWEGTAGWERLVDMLNELKS